MKKQLKKERKLSLKKVRLMKVSEMKSIHGGDGNTFVLLGGDNDTIATKPKTLGGGL